MQGKGTGLAPATSGSTDLKGTLDDVDLGCQTHRGFVQIATGVAINYTQ